MRKLFMDTLLTEYKLFLKERKVSFSSIKNYLVDARNFLGWYSLFLKTNKNLHNPSNRELFSLLSPEIVSQYKSFLVDNNNPNSTVNRRLSGVRKLSSFAISQDWIVTNPAKMVSNVGASLRKVENDNWKRDILKQFADDLKKEEVSKTTIKNYLSDTMGFLSFVDQVI